MDNNKLPTIEGSEGNLDRRSFLKQALGVLAGAVVVGTATDAENALAQDIGQAEVTPVSTKPTTFEYIESQWGINYRGMAESPLAEILSIAENEFREKATPVFKEKTPRYWKGISKSVSKGTISKSMIGRLREFTPTMLQQFAVGLDPQDPTYGYLQAIGTNFIAKKLADSST